MACRLMHEQIVIASRLLCRQDKTMPGFGQTPTETRSRRRATCLIALLLFWPIGERHSAATEDGPRDAKMSSAQDQASATGLTHQWPVALESFSDTPADDVAPDIQFSAQSHPVLSSWVSSGSHTVAPADGVLKPLPSWLESTRVGYDRGFVVASERSTDLQTADLPFMLRVNGLLQLRHSHLNSTGINDDLNQFQLIRGRLAFSGQAITRDLSYFVQLDGRSSAGDEFRLLDYFMSYDLGRSVWDLDRGTLVFKAGKYKVPFTLARYLSAREFEFSDRSVASMYFDINRSLAWGLCGQSAQTSIPIEWETALFNGLVTGGSETGSSGALDNNFAYSARLFAYPVGDWGTGSLADLDWHQNPAVRLGAGFAYSTIARDGPTEFELIRVVDSGRRLSALLPDSVDQYDVCMYCLDASCKYRGWSVTSEYYFRNVSGFEGAEIPSLFDHGVWLQVGKFIVPGRWQLISRWSRVVGDSGTLGREDQSSDEIAAGCVWYFRGQNAKLTFDATHLDGAPINASSLDIFPGDMGWLFRTQIQLAF